MKAKPLDKKALLYLKGERERGKTISSLTPELTNMGYTQLSGGELCNATVSHFLIDNGMRTITRRKVKKGAYKKAHKGYVSSPSSNNLEQNETKALAALVFESNLPTTKKLNLLKELL